MVPPHRGSPHPALLRLASNGQVASVIVEYAAGCNVPGNAAVNDVVGQPVRRGAQDIGHSFGRVGSGRAAGVETVRRATAVQLYVACTGQKSVLDAVTPLLQFVLLKCYRIGTSGTHKSWKIGNSVLDA